MHARTRHTPTHTGDGTNDLEMVEWAGWGVAPSNAARRVRLAANEVLAESNDEEAVACRLEGLLAGKGALAIRASRL